MAVGEHERAAAVAVVLYGSRGDVQPGVCLALELQARGVRTSVVAPPNHVDFARIAGVYEVYPIGLDSHAAWSSPEAQSAQRSSNPLVRVRFALTTVRAGFRAFDDSLTTLFIENSADGTGPELADVDALVVAPLCQDRGLAIAERLGVPMTILRYGPMSENGVLGALPGLTDGWSASWKRRSWRIADALTWLATGWNENGFRSRLGLPRVWRPLPRRLDRAKVPQIQAFDPALVPGLADEWGALRPIVGYFDLAAENRRELDGIGVGDTDSGARDLVEWLDAGDPPVFITFGSMPLGDADGVVARLRHGVRSAGRRCLVAVAGCAHAAGPDSADPDVYYVAAVNHSAILPRCVAAVHHGGAGTTAAVLRAGLPMFICAVTADQPFWGQRITELGVGSAIRLKSLTDVSAADGIARMLDPTIRDAARELGAFLVSPEKAVATAADIIESRLG